METKTCTYRVNQGGEISSFTTSCTIQRRGGFSKVAITSGESSYTFLVGKNAVTLTAEGQTKYSFCLSEGCNNPFEVYSQGVTFNALVSCKNLSIILESGNILVKAKYFMNISGVETQMEFTLSVE